MTFSVLRPCTDNQSLLDVAQEGRHSKSSTMAYASSDLSLVVLEGLPQYTCSIE